MLRKIALATITAAALVAPPSLVHAALNGASLNGIHPNGLKLNGMTLNGIEPARREVYLVGEQTGGESSTVLAIELPQDDVTR